MTDAGTARRIEELPLFGQFHPKNMDKLRKLARHLCFDAGQVIFGEGDDSTLFYVILSGHVALEISAPQTTLNVRTLGPGDEFGWSALLPGRAKHFQARSVDTVEALAFEGSELLDLCHEDPAFGYELMHHLLGLVADRLNATRLQLSDYYSPHAKRAGA